MMLPATVTQQRGVPSSFYCMVIQSAPAYRARTQHVESVQKATKAGTIREMFRFESDEKVACTRNCPNIGQLEGWTRLPYSFPPFFFFLRPLPLRPPPGPL